MAKVVVDQPIQRFSPKTARLGVMLALAAAAAALHALLSGMNVVQHAQVDGL